ncbi:hypothetical protein [Mesobacillus stamsii]|uniref:MarR family transcriptional regulator n=1 Tax=Mesobacillus stamsii TaxID=225347 RepID=A0ABU0FTP1_9BACI|nr:hypothetical protein [Mesobacillus stamsii]MDQ0412704.1 hypothetical protein [Mesobacillus stamsii]
MDKTKLDINNPHHQLLIGTLSMFVDDFGYTTRELFELMNDSQKQLWSGLVEMGKEKR